MDIEDWNNRMSSAVDTARFFADCDVIDISFDNGSVMEVYVAISPEQRSRGLASISSIDLDGMLFYFDKPSYVPFTAEKMVIPIDIAWYAADGTLLALRRNVAPGTGALFSQQPFSYVLEAPPGIIPKCSLVMGGN